MRYAFLLYTIVALLVILIMFMLRFGPYESAEDLILATILWDDTAYSAKYSDSKFREITIGDTKRQVLELIGEPLIKKTYPPDKHNDTQEYWWYSRSPSSNHYHQRLVVFSSNGVVQQIVREFYVD